MRKVLFKKWIPIEYEYVDCVPKKAKGTDCWEIDFKNEGLFHQWASSYVEFETGAGNFTVALVELSDGTIAEVLPSNLKFVTP